MSTNSGTNTARKIKRKARKGARFVQQVADGVQSYRVTDDVQRFGNGSVIYRCEAVGESEWGDEPPIYLAEGRLLEVLENERRWKQAKP